MMVQQMAQKNLLKKYPNLNLIKGDGNLYWADQ